METTTTSNSQFGLIGQVVAGLRVRQLLGSGGMGQVYLADQIDLGTTRALKVIDANYLADEQVLARFRREAKVLSRLHHNHIIEVLDFGELGDGTLFLSMEFIDGGDLETYLETHGAMDLVGGLRILKDIADAVRYAHGENVLHRDLKPGNIVLRAGDASHAKIIDFGLVTLVGPERATKLTEANMVVGTPHFMAPEQIHGVEELTGAVDVYALAGLAYALFTGHSVFPPDDHASVLSMVRAHCYDEPVRLSERKVQCVIPEFLDTLLLACLAKNPEHRPSAEEVSFHFARLYNEAIQTTASRAIARPNADADIAEMLWSDAVMPRTPEQGRLDALGKQIEEVLLALGEASEDADVQSRTECIQQASSSLGSLQLEQALLTSDADEREGSLQADRMRQRILMGARIDELETVLRQQFREFYVRLMARSRDLSEGEDDVDSDEAHLFQMLEQLVETVLESKRK